MEQLETAFAKTRLAPSSQKQHAKKMAQWMSLMPPQSIDDFLADSDAAMEALNAATHIKQTPTNRHLYLSAVIAYLMHIVDGDIEECIASWKEKQKANSEPIEEHYASNEPTKAQKEKCMPMEEIVACRDRLTPGSYERLLLCFYTMMEPIRADYYATQIIREGEEAKEENYLVLGENSARIVVTDFKTKQHHSPIENTLPTPLYQELITSLQRHPRSYLFVKEDGETPYVRKIFSNWACKVLTRVLKHPMTLTVLRHLYITEKMNENTPLEEMKQIAKKMGHTREMQRVYEWQQ